jgi:cytochrome c peroxidase
MRSVVFQQLLFFLCCVLLILPEQLVAQPLELPEPLRVLPVQDPARVELGKTLFFDRRLSGDGTISCAVCHIPDEAFADGQKISSAYPTNKHWRHTSSLLNVGYLYMFFWDGRSRSLEDQALGPIHTSFEMNLNPRYLVAKLKEILEYQQLFEKAWGGGVTLERIVGSLAAFERTLLVSDSPFDRFLGGEREILSKEAKQGMQIFFSERGNCAKCHAGRLLTDQKFYNLGIAELPELSSDPQHRSTRNFFLGEMGLEAMNRDPGHYAVTHKESDMGAFRTPPLRQVEQTGPYMHNGSFATLAEVIEFFSQGGGDDPNKTELLKPLGLSVEEKLALEAFLRSLTGTYQPVRAPRPPGS